MDLNDLPLATPIASSRSAFGEALGVPAALLHEAEIERLRPAADREMARDWPESLLLRKAHDAYASPLMGEGPAFSAVYILRDPWDVAVSMTNHFRCTLAEAVAKLCDPAFAIARSRRGLNAQLRQHLGTWESHALGWLGAPMRLCLLRYEAMKARPLEEFSRAVRFLGLPHDEADIAAALEACRFDRLQALERAQRFRETPRGSPGFFRRGETGEGLARLGPAERAPLEAMKARVEAAIASRTQAEARATEPVPA